MLEVAQGYWYELMMVKVMERVRWKQRECGMVMTTVSSAWAQATTQWVMGRWLSRSRYAGGRVEFHSDEVDQSSWGCQQARHGKVVPGVNHLGGR